MILNRPRHLLLTELQMAYQRLEHGVEIATEIDALQKEFDEACEAMRREAPEGTYWKRHERT